MMDYGSLMDNLQNRFDEYVDDNGIEHNDNTMSKNDEFLSMAKERIEEMLTGGLDMQEAYDMYAESELVDDLKFVFKA